MKRETICTTRAKKENLVVWGKKGGGSYLSSVGAKNNCKHSTHTQTQTIVNCVREVREHWIECGHQAHNAVCGPQQSSPTPRSPFRLLANEYPPSAFSIYLPLSLTQFMALIQVQQQQRNLQQTIHQDAAAQH